MGRMMNYTKLEGIANVADHKSRLLLFSEIYKSVEVKGFHYVNFIPGTNTIVIADFNNQILHYPTTYILTKKINQSDVNTVRGYAADIKKFLDFLMIWNISDLNTVNLRVILEAFIDYLQLLSKFELIMRNKLSIEWSFTNRIKLNTFGESGGTVIPVKTDNLGNLVVREVSDYPPKTISKIINTIASYLEFLKKRTQKYASLKLEDLPHKLKRIENYKSGTAGPAKIVCVDIAQILHEVGLKGVSKDYIVKLPADAIFNTEEIKELFSVFNNAQDRLLFTILINFGLRIGEAAGIKLNVSTLPANLLRMDYHQAREHLRNSFICDLEYVTSHGKSFWVCNVEDRGQQDYRSSYKKHGEQRQIPWLFNQEELLDLILEALRERQVLLRHLNAPDHGFLFVSRNRKNRGAPINGKSIEKKYEQNIKKLKLRSGIELNRFSCHTFRHFFATYMLKVLEIQIDDVSRWLGHSNTETTRTIYSHWIPRKENSPNEGTLNDILSTFKNHQNSEATYE